MEIIGPGTYPDYIIHTSVPDNYVRLEVQQKTKFLLEIWRTIGDHSTIPGSLQQKVKDEVLENLIELIKEVFPKKEIGIGKGYQIEKVLESEENIHSRVCIYVDDKKYYPTFEGKQY